MNLKFLTPPEAITAIYYAKKSYQAFNLFKNYIIREESSVKAVLTRLESAATKLPPNSEELNFCQLLIKVFASKPDDCIILKECLIICAQLKKFEDPLQRFIYFSENRPLSLGEYIISAFEEKDINPALKIILKQFWHSVDKLNEVKHLFFDAQRELISDSPEWKFCQKMMAEINHWETMNETKFVEIILETTGWSKDPVKYADNYVNGGARLDAAVISLKLASVILSAGIEAQRPKGFWQRFKP